MKEGDLLGSYHVKTSPFNLYTGRKDIKRLKTTNDLINFFLNSKNQVFCLIKKKDLEELEPIVPFYLFRWDIDKIGGREIALISNRERS